MVNPQYEIEYSDEKVTAWGGMRLMKEVLERSGVSRHLSEAPLPEPGSNRGYSPSVMVGSFLVNVWMGCYRMSHTEVLRRDDTLKELFGWKQTPSGSSYGRFFNKFSQARNQAVFPTLQQRFMENIPLRKLTLDVDSSVIVRYGNKEGVARGYNPGKPGRGSHHPLLAFVTESRMVANAWMRPGNTGASSSVEHFLEETFGILGLDRIGLLRADSGFCSEKMMSYFEQRGIPYIVAAKFHSGIRSKVRSARWIRLKDGVEVCETRHVIGSCGKERRLILVRKDAGRLPLSTGRQLEIWEDEALDSRYRYSAYFTSLELPASSIWCLYRDRGDAENRIKELKYDFGIEGFHLKNFCATEAAFRFAIIAYNLLSLFRKLVLQGSSQPTLSSLRSHCFALGAWISSHARKRTLKISLHPKKRPWLDGLFSKTDSLAPPFTQFCRS